MAPAGGATAHTPNTYTSKLRASQIYKFSPKTPTTFISRLQQTKLKLAVVEAGVEAATAAPTSTTKEMKKKLQTRKLPPHTKKATAAAAVTTITARLMPHKACK